MYVSAEFMNFMYYLYFKFPIHVNMLNMYTLNTPAIHIYIYICGWS